MIKFILNLFRMLFGNRFQLRKIKKSSEREVKDDKEAGGMDSVRNRATRWHQRNRR